MNKQCPRNKDSNFGPNQFPQLGPQVLNNHSISSILAKEITFSPIQMLKKGFILEFINQIHRKYIFVHKVPNYSYLFVNKLMKKTKKQCTSKLKQSHAIDL